MTMTFCSPQDQSTGRETCSAGMVSDQLLGTRQSEKGVKWEKNGAKNERVGLKLGEKKNRIKTQFTVFFLQIYHDFAA